MGDLLRLAHSPERNARGHFLQGLGFHAGDHFGLDEARGHACDANTVAGQLLRPDHGGGRHAGLGRGIVGLAHVAGAGNRRDVHDHACALKLHQLRRDLAGAEEHPREVDIDHRLPLGQAHLADHPVLDLEQQAVAQDAGIVDQAVEAAEILGDLCDHAADLLFVGDIAQIGTCVATGALAGRHGCGQAFLVEVDQRQACALGGQMLRHRAAEPLAAAGNDDDLVFQLHGTLHPVVRCEPCPR